MPPPCTDDWNAVKNTAVALNSIKEAAELHNVPYEAARMRASREKWPVGHRTAKAIANAVQINRKQIAKANPAAVTAVTTTSEALISKLKEDGEQTKLSLSKGVRKAAEFIEKQPGILLFTGADRVKQIVASASQLHGWDTASSGGSINLNILTNQAAVQVNAGSQSKQD